jgi:protein-disulfide isomerase
MTTETKAISAIVIITILVIIGGVFLMNSQSSNLPEVAVNSDILVRPDSPTKQSEQNHVTIVEFADYECPSCAALHPVLKQLLNDPEYGKYVTLVYRNIPLHAGSIQVSVAVQAAGAQGKYWEMHDLVYERQDEWASVAASNEAKRAELFEKYATEIGLDIPAWKEALNDDKYVDLIKRDQADALTMKIRATPTLIINGINVIKGVVSYENLKAAVDAELAKNN